MVEPAEKPKPKRRWRQFSLRTFFVLVTVLCVWFGWQVHRTKQQREAVEWVKSIGGTVNYDYEFDEAGQRIFDAQPPAPKWLRDVFGGDFFSEVRRVGLAYRQVTDLTPLANLTNFESLHIDDTRASDLTPLATKTHLRSLVLNNTPVSDLTPLVKLTNLEELCLDRTAVSDLTPVANLTRLERFSSNETQINNLAPLANLTNLKWLYLNGTSLNDLAPLANLSQLQFLFMEETEVDENEVIQLRKALPDCFIYWTPPRQSDPVTEH